MPGPTRLDELTAWLRAPDPRRAVAALTQELVPGQTSPADHIVAIVWATDDLDRTIGQTPMPFRRAARDRILDGRTAAVRYGVISLLIEAPVDPEHGRIAAYLSHYGEGVAAFYLERPRYLPPSRASERPPRPVQTPFGRRGWLLPHEWPWGPFVIALEDER
jgi:hypothetical protein